MATTTAAITITSTDLLSDSLSLSTTSTLTKAGGAVGLDQTSGLGRKTTTSTSPYTLFDGTDYTVDKAHKLYLKNTSTTDSEFFLLTVNAEDIGRIYAGDWALIPWSAHDNDCDIKITPSVSTTMTLEYMLIFEA
tara:strand:- start:123 stop:527 length:405 start_codon:yes stop_codon:yes gene_type:complete